MRACIYARAWGRERASRCPNIDRQVEMCTQLLREHNLLVEARHVLTDRDHDGTSPPTCWATDGDPDARPALDRLVEIIEARLVNHVIVVQADRLGTASEVLGELMDLFDAFDVQLIMPADALKTDDPALLFPLSAVRRRVVVDAPAERKRKAKIKSRKLEELGRLQAKVARLEAEISEL